MNEIPDCYYRVSVKALILNEDRSKFLVCEKESGVWELPGGGLEWGMTPQEDLVREIKEEMGLTVEKIAEHPAYFITAQTLNRKVWIVNVVYETAVKDLNFIPSEECVKIKFVDKDELKKIKAFPAVIKLCEIFDPSKHLM